MTTSEALGIDAINLIFKIYYSFFIKLKKFILYSTYSFFKWIVIYFHSKS